MVLYLGAKLADTRDSIKNYSGSTARSASYLNWKICTESAIEVSKIGISNDYSAIFF